MMTIRTTVLLFVLSFLASPLLADDRPMTYRELLDLAEQQLKAQLWEDAIDTYQDAAKLDKPTFACFYGMAVAQNSLKRYEEGAETSRQAMAVAEEPFARAIAANQLGVGLYAEGKANIIQTEEAAQAFEQAIEESGDQLPIARFNLAFVLFKLKYVDRALENFQKYVDAVPEGPNADTARFYLNNPRRAAAGTMPNFEVTTLTGETLSPALLQGKVVLLDFWGTWCAPCIEAIPHLKRLSKKMKKDPFVVVSIANDRDVEVLKKFIEQKKMDWPQVWDEHREIGGQFGIRSYPTYVLFDHEGVATYQKSGWSSSVEIDVSREVAKAIRRAKKNGS